MDMKVCRTCNVEKPLDQFYRNFTYKDYHESQCKPCRSAANAPKRAERYKLRKEAYLKQQAELKEAVQ